MFAPFSLTIVSITQGYFVNGRLFFASDLLVKICTMCTLCTMDHPLGERAPLCPIIVRPIFPKLRGLEK